MRFLKSEGEGGNNLSGERKGMKLSGKWRCRRCLFPLDRWRNGISENKSGEKQARSGREATNERRT